MTGAKKLPLIFPVAVRPEPQWIFERMEGQKGDYGFVLESALTSERQGRFSWVGIDPFLVMESKEHQVKLYWSGRQKSYNVDPFKMLKQLLDRNKVPNIQAPVPFWGGAVGFFSYDLGRQVEELPVMALDDTGMPDLLLGFYDTVVAVDHFTATVYICSTGLPEVGDEGVKRAGLRAALLAEKLGVTLPPSLNQAASNKKSTPAFTYDPERSEPPDRPVSVNTMTQMGEISLSSLHSHFNRESYCRAVEKAKEYIAAGDIFQVNLSQRLTAPTDLPAWELYRRLSRINPAPFASFLQYPGMAVVGASPERFLSLTNKRLETRPIKGTRPRGKDEQSDRAMREELWNSVKDRAELTMIIDLERNDLGRVCRIGTVKVPELFSLEEYPTVFHLVSTVVGVLDDEKTVVDLLRATFPGGSITGAPKIRAMEIIEELEPVRRSVYTGSTGWIGFHGDADLNIVIRTYVIKDGWAHIQVGGGITADSVPEAEYEETLDKARALIKALIG